MNKILSIKDITKVYQSNGKLHWALNGITLDIFRGEIFSLLGPNGAGKTTLSSILATLHPPTSGDILYNGNSIHRNVNAYRQELGFCPQTQNLDNALTVQENLYFAGRYLLMPKNRVKQRVQELLDRLDLERYKDFTISKLSGGNKQRVLIARALIHEPKIVILDEPTVGLDPDIRRKLWQIIKDLKALGITVILTTHYLDEAEVLSDRVCILYQGKVSLTESLAELKEKHNMAKLEDIFLRLTQNTQE